ncbi:MAG: hypothetical protein ACK4FF_05585 [Limnobacter sp.]|uniref:hypothetical protein n=1 Tax=Limnobacter sp. TaxID=2003368 RepID=UPI00391CE753
MKFLKLTIPFQYMAVFKVASKPVSSEYKMTPQLDAAGSAQIMDMVRHNRPSVAKAKRLQSLALKARKALAKPIA